MVIYISFIISYLIGSFPTAVLVGIIFYNTDVRKFGSKNPGATNTLRTLGKKAAIIVLLVDVFKGFIATKLPIWLPANTNGLNMIDFQLICGLFAILGHIFPIFIKFKGGKGIATAFGVALSLYFTASIISLTTFILVVAISRYVSLGSIIAAITFSTVTLFTCSDKTLLETMFFITITCVVIITHRRNICKLFRRTENKISFKR